MAKQFPGLGADHQEFIARQKIFFVASASASSHVNLSPRGSDLFRVTGTNSVAYLDKTGSGNETAAHIRAGGRVTIMFCAFEGPPQILRLYGSGVVHARRSHRFAALLKDRFSNVTPPGTRHIVELCVELVQTSCGYGVPRFTYRGERNGLDRWAEQKGPSGLQAYWQEKNSGSLDLLPTGIDDPTESQ